MIKKKMILLIAVIIITISLFTGCENREDVITVYNKALEKTNQIQRPHEIASFEVTLISKDGEKEYKTVIYQDKILDKELGIAAGKVKIKKEDEVIDLEIYERGNFIYTKTKDTDKYFRYSDKERYIPDIREKCFEAILKMVEGIEKEESLEKLLRTNRKDTGEVIISTKIENKEIEDIMFKIVKEGIASEQVKNEAAEETIEKMKEMVKSLGEEISDEEIEKTVNEQIKIIDDELQALFNNFKCDDTSYTVTINNEGYVINERVLFTASDKDSKASIEIKIDYQFKGESSGSIEFPKITQENIVIK